MIAGIVHRIGSFLLAGLLLAAAGCNMGGQVGGAASRGRGAPTPPQSQEELERLALANTESRILDVIAYYPTPIRWVWTEDKTRVRGIIVSAVYLVGPEGKGVFGDGVLRPRILVHDRLEPDPSKEWKLVKEWELRPVDLLLLRSKRPTIQGHGYMIPLHWDDLDLGGAEIRIIITYEPSDGMPAPRFSSKDLRVPKRAG